MVSPTGDAAMADHTTESGITKRASTTHQSSTDVQEGRQLCAALIDPHLAMLFEVLQTASDYLEVRLSGGESPSEPDTEERPLRSCVGKAEPDVCIKVEAFRQHIFRDSVTIDGAQILKARALRHLSCPTESAPYLSLVHSVEHKAVVDKKPWLGDSARTQLCKRQIVAEYLHGAHAVAVCTLDLHAERETGWLDIDQEIAWGCVERLRVRVEQADGTLSRWGTSLVIAQCPLMQLLLFDLNLALADLKLLQVGHRLFDLVEPGDRGEMPLL